jgi:hypothetical protein
MDTLEYLETLRLKASRTLGARIIYRMMEIERNMGDEAPDGQSFNDLWDALLDELREEYE